jgi:osmoprotectant transport system permease protein
MNLFGYLQDPSTWYGPGQTLELLLQHLGYTAAAVGIAAVIGIPLGLLLGHTRRAAWLVAALRNGTRALPALGLLVLVALALGSGFGAILVVLTVVAFLVILAATATGALDADREAVHSARALGLSEPQIVTQVEWPLALPMAIAGLRTAAVQVIAMVTVAAFVGGGGLGRLLVDGRAGGNNAQLFAGVFLIAIVAIVAYLLLSLLVWRVARQARPGRPTMPSYAAVA